MVTATTAVRPIRGRELSRWWSSRWSGRWRRRSCARRRFVHQIFQFLAWLEERDFLGRNFNALNDSIAHGNINEVEVPYCVVIQNYELISAGAKRMADDFIDVIHEIGTRGCPVEIRTDKRD